MLPIVVLAVLVFMPAVQNRSKLRVSLRCLMQNLGFEVRLWVVN